MGDLISRQEAIDAICDYTDDLFNQITALEDLPSVQPELPSCGYCPFAKCTIDDDKPCSMKGVERVERLNQQTKGN